MFVDEGVCSRVWMVDGVVIGQKADMTFAQDCLFIVEGYDLVLIWLLNILPTLFLEHMTLQLLAIIFAAVLQNWSTKSSTPWHFKAYI